MTKTQRLIAFFLMNEAFPIKNSPFGLFLLDICESTQDQFEKKYLYQLVISNKREVLKIN